MTNRQTDKTIYRIHTKESALKFQLTIFNSSRGNRIFWLTDKLLDRKRELKSSFAIKNDLLLNYNVISLFLKNKVVPWIGSRTTDAH